MKFEMLVLISFIFTFAVINGEQWAVIVAGSNGYYNYRHQVLKQFVKQYLI